MVNNSSQLWFGSLPLVFCFCRDTSFIFRSLRTFWDIHMCIYIKSILYCLLMDSSVLNVGETMAKRIWLNTSSICYPILSEKRNMFFFLYNSSNLSRHFTKRNESSCELMYMNIENCFAFSRLHLIPLWWIKCSFALHYKSERNCYIVSFSVDKWISDLKCKIYITLLEASIFFFQMRWRKNPLEKFVVKCDADEIQRNWTKCFPLNLWY